MTRTDPAPEDMRWALAEASKEALAVAPGWFRAWPFGDEKWSAVNVRSATQIIVNHSREDDRHPNSWTVRAHFGGHAVELLRRVGPQGKLIGIDFDEDELAEITDQATAITVGSET